MADSTNDSFEAALARYLDGEPEPGDGEMIAAVLRESPEKVRELSGLVAVEELLRQHGEPGQNLFVDGVAERLEAQTSGRRFMRGVRRRLGPGTGTMPAAARNWLPWILTAAACVAAVLGWWRVVEPAANPTPGAVAALPTPLPGEPLALMVNQSHAKFAPGAAPDVVSFGRGGYSLVEGAAHLRFRNGTDVVIVAPTRFAIDDALRVRLDEGTLRALVPVTAHGFVVVAQDVQYKDLGTEFGVRVRPGGKGSELHVFDGQVEVFNKGQSKPEQTVLGGESIAVADGVLRPAGKALEGEFPSANSISLSRWDAWRSQFRADPDLVFHLPFVQDAKDRLALNDDAEHGVGVRGRIEGAEWVTGRWPGKKALQFEDAGDGVSLNIPGEFDRVTLAAWMKVDRVENAEHSIVSSAGWAPGALQWQFNRRLSVASTSVFSDPKRRVVWANSSLPVGQWVHWVTTIDRQTGKILHYVNGKLACEARIEPGSLIKPGACTIGRWIDDGELAQVREFRGRIDEMAMWRVVLSPGRIAELAEAGMPVELPEPAR